MTKLPRFIITITLVVLFGLLSANCITIPPFNCPADSIFDSCFESNDFGNTVIRLVDECGGISGVLLIGLPSDPAFRSYSLEGVVKQRASANEIGIAELTGILSFPNGMQTEQITVFIGSDDTMSLVIGNQAPIGPMSRCVGN